MSLCPYYETWQKVSRSNEISSSREPSYSKISAHYCSHDQSTVTKADVIGTIGGGLLLKCRGDVARCQLPNGMKPGL